jgi:hypothetical protein
MTIVSIEEFVTDPDKYLNVAAYEKIYVKRGLQIFTMIRKRKRFKSPDDDLRSAIPIEDVRDSIIDYFLKKNIK